MSWAYKYQSLGLLLTLDFETRGDCLAKFYLFKKNLNEASISCQRRQKLTTEHEPL
jgi:hypothetical protein